MPTLGPYEIRGELGRGAMAVVWRGFDPKLEREVAIKEPLFVPTLDPAVREELIARFVHEGKAVAAFSHPGIVTVFAADVYDERPALVMELVEGSTLGEVLQQGSLSQGAAVAIAEQLLQALDYAHSRGVVHRDIKPDNVFVTDDGRVKLADFGIARFEDRTSFTQEGTVMGTPGYMAPEQVRGLGTDARADIFAVGVVLFEMLTGENPFGANAGLEPTAIMYRIVHEDPPALPTATDDSLRNVALVALNKDPEHRFQSAEEMRQAISGTGTSRNVVAVQGQVPVQQKRIPSWAVAAAAVAITAVGLGIWFGGGSGTGASPSATASVTATLTADPVEAVPAVEGPTAEDLAGWLADIEESWAVVERGWNSGEPEPGTYGAHFWSMHQKDFPLVETPLNRLDRELAELEPSTDPLVADQVSALEAAGKQLRSFLDVWPDDTSPERVAEFGRTRWAVYRAQVLVSGSAAEKESVGALDQLAATLPEDVPVWVAVDEQLGPAEVASGGAIGGFMAASGEEYLYELTWPDTDGALVAGRIDASKTPFSVPDYLAHAGGLTVSYTGGNAVYEWDFLDPRSATPEGAPVSGGPVVVYGFSPGGIPYDEAEASLLKMALVD